MSMLLNQKPMDIINDFLLPALNSKKYGFILHWRNRSRKIFWMRWIDPECPGLKEEEDGRIYFDFYKMKLGSQINDVPITVSYRCAQDAMRYFMGKSKRLVEARHFDDAFRYYRIINRSGARKRYGCINYSKKWKKLRMIVKNKREIQAEIFCSFENSDSSSDAHVPSMELHVDYSSDESPRLSDEPYDDCSDKTDDSSDDSGDQSNDNSHDDNKESVCIKSSRGIRWIRNYGFSDKGSDFSDKSSSVRSSQARGRSFGAQVSSHDREKGSVVPLHDFAVSFIRDLFNYCTGKINSIAGLPIPTICSGDMNDKSYYSVYLDFIGYSNPAVAGSRPTFMKKISIQDFQSIIGSIGCCGAKRADIGPTIFLQYSKADIVKYVSQLTEDRRSCVTRKKTRETSF